MSCPSQAQKRELKEVLPQGGRGEQVEQAQKRELKVAVSVCVSPAVRHTSPKEGIERRNAVMVFDEFYLDKPKRGN